MSPLIVQLGGRKFCAFLLLHAAMVLFVITGHLKDEKVIAQIFFGLIGVYAGANVVQKGITVAADKLATPKGAP